MTGSPGKLPPIGFGCAPYRSGRRIDLGSSIELAIQAGYRLLDTAEAYGNEARIGKILSQLPPSRATSASISGVAPLVVSKVWQTNHAYEDVLSACRDSLQRLGLDALDLYLIHAPESWQHVGPLGDLSRQPGDTGRWLTAPRREDGARALAAVPLIETWSAMEELRRRGLVRAIGVSNFERTHLEELLSGAKVAPEVNQIERHPYRPRTELARFCTAHGIRLMAHSPLSSAGLLEEPVLAKIAQRHKKCPAQIVLRWNVEHGVVPIPSSRNPRRVVENLDIFDFVLDASDVAKIDGLARVATSRVT